MRLTRDNSITYAKAAELEDFLRQVTAVCEKASAGDLEERLDVADDSYEQIKSCTDGLNRILDLTDAFIRESSASLQHAAAQKFWRQFMEVGFPGAYARGSKVINKATQHLAEQTAVIAKQEECERQNRSSVGSKFHDQTSSALLQISASCKAIDHTSNDLNRNINKRLEDSAIILNSAESNISLVKDLGKCSGELAEAVSIISRQVDESASMAKLTVKEAESTRQIVETLVATSEKVSGITSLIQKIASQTSLLALNATIEAARAGSFGKGFAVVASEVKELANQTGDATRSIAKEINFIRASTEAVVQEILLIMKTINHFEKVSGEIRTSAAGQRFSFADMIRSVESVESARAEIQRSISGLRKNILSTTAVGNDILRITMEIDRTNEQLKSEAHEFVNNISK